MTAVVRCPVCAAAVRWTDASIWRPFCSQRCKTIDLGDWASNRHVIAGEAAEPAGTAPAGDDPSKPRS